MNNTETNTYNSEYFAEFLTDRIDSSFRNLSTELGDDLSIIEVMYLNLSRMIKEKPYNVDVMDDFASSIDYILSLSKEQTKERVLDAMQSFFLKLEEE